MVNRTSRKRSLGYLLLAVVLLLGGVECFARFYLGLGNPPLLQAHPTIEYLFKPNQEVLRFGNRFTTNRYSMRSDDFPPHKASPDELRVMVYGDSVVNGGNQTDHSRLATQMLQENLHRTYQQPVIVGNVSAGSWGPPNQLAYLRQFGPLDADVFVLVLSSHDFADVPTFAPLEASTTQAPWSATWEGVTRYLPRFLPFTPVDAPPSPQNPQLVKSEDIEGALSAMRELLSTAAATGATVILVQHWTEPELRANQTERGHDAIRAIAQELNVPVYDDVDVFRQYIAAGRNPFRDYIHPNDVGQAALQELLFSALQREALEKLTSHGNASAPE